MKANHKLAGPLVIGFCSLVALAALAEACSFGITFRAYLRGGLWKPTWRYVGELTAGLPAENSAFQAYAGMKPDTAGPLERARTAYRALFPDATGTATSIGVGPLNWPESTIRELRELLASTTPANASERHELELMQCKVELRAIKDRNDPGLPQVRSCFESYLRPPRPPQFYSEARGWLARTEVLLGRGSAASKIYLDELASETSNIRRERLLLSLQKIQPREDDLEGYFDTPAHALFAVNQATSSYRMTYLGAALVTKLEAHAALFNQGRDSDALALALMRTSLMMGAPDAVIRYSERVAQSSSGRDGAEYNWLVGAAQYLRKDYRAAEQALLRVLAATDVDTRILSNAANGLVGVYARLNRPVEQLWAAFTAESYRSSIPRGEERVPLYPEFDYELQSTYQLPAFSFDTGYLLDAELTDEELNTFITRYGSAGNSPDAPSLTGPPLLKARYAQAVRLSRKESYDAASKIYMELGVQERAERTRQAAQLLARTRAANRSSERRLEALFEYADFLSRNQDQIFFNDQIWFRFQTGAFTSPRDSDNESAYVRQEFGGPSADELERYRQLDRRLRDEQEEYWRAYKILNQIVADAGRTELGRKAARRAIYCLRRTRTDRFGRLEEIRQADLRLSSWLAR